MQTAQVQTELSQEVINRVERDLRCYPDWIVRMEVSGLGITSRATMSGGSASPSLSSLVELDVQLSDEIKKKVYVIERVYDRLHGKAKDLIEYRYFQNYGRDDVILQLKIKKWKFYALRDRTLESFARAFGYIE